MLTINPAKRVTATDALKHPWICVGVTHTHTNSLMSPLRVVTKCNYAVIIVTKNKVKTSYIITYCLCVHSNAPLWHPWCTDRRLWSAWRNLTREGNSRWVTIKDWASRFRRPVVTASNCDDDVKRSHLSWKYCSTCSTFKSAKSSYSTQDIQSLTFHSL